MSLGWRVADLSPKRLASPPLLDPHADRDLDHRWAERFGRHLQCGDARQGRFLTGAIARSMMPRCQNQSRKATSSIETDRRTDCLSLGFAVALRAVAGWLADHGALSSFIAMVHDYLALHIQQTGDHVFLAPAQRLRYLVATALQLNNYWPMMLAATAFATSPVSGLTESFSNKPQSVKASSSCSVVTNQLGYRARPHGRTEPYPFPWRLYDGVEGPFGASGS